MSHIHHQMRTGLICNLTEPLKINGAAICAGTGNDQLGMGFHRLLFQLVIVNKSLVVDSIGNDIEIQAREVHRTSMGQMAAVIQVHSHHRISWL